MKNIILFHLKIFQFLEVKFSIYLNKRVSVMLIDPVLLFSQCFITLLVSMTTMKWTGLFYTIFIFYQELDLYYGNKPLYLRHSHVAMATEV